MIPALPPGKTLPMDLVMNLDANLCFGSQGIARTNTRTTALQNPSVAGVTGATEDDAYARTESGQQIQPLQQQSQQGTFFSGAEMGSLAIPDGEQQAYQSEVDDFTKEQGWSQSVLEELRDFLHIITPDGRILYVSPSCRSITGYEPQSLLGELIGKYVHPDDNDTFTRELQESLASGNPLRFFYRFIREDGTCVIFECNGHPHISFTAGASTQPCEAEPPVPLFKQAATGVCLGFFITARPYRNKVNALLDSALGLKMEHERLMHRVKKLRREKARETAEQYRLRRDQFSSRVGGRTSGSQSNGSRGSSSRGDAPYNRAARLQLRKSTMQARKPALSSNSVLSARGQETIASEIPRCDHSSTHLEMVELLTGLQYPDGERSHGISTSDVSPALLFGVDVSVAIPTERSAKENRSGVANVYTCAECRTLDSPEWRSGPLGHKTLCNACGLRWAKREKRKKENCSGVKNTTALC